MMYVYLNKNILILQRVYHSEDFSLRMLPAFENNLWDGTEVRIKLPLLLAIIAKIRKLSSNAQ